VPNYSKMCGLDLSLVWFDKIQNRFLYVQKVSLHEDNNSSVLGKVFHHRKFHQLITHRNKNLMQTTIDYIPLINFSNPYNAQLHWTTRGTYCYLHLNKFDGRYALLIGLKTLQLRREKCAKLFTFVSSFCLW